MKKIIILVRVLTLAACSSRQELRLTDANLSGSLSLIPKMQLKASQEQTIYQEINEGTGQILDSLIIQKERLDLPLVAYVQQSFNQLRLAGYQISEELTQKKSLKSWLNSERFPAILKTYRIVNMLGVKLYAAQYYVDFVDSVLIISYTSDKLPNIKSFIQSVDQLSFTL